MLIAEQLALLLLQTVMVAGILLALFRLRTRLSLCPLYVAIGVFQPIQVLLAASVYIEIAPGLVVSPGSMIMFTGSLFALLLVYIREDAREARTVIYALMLSNLVVTCLYLIFDQQLRMPNSLNPLGLPVDLFQINSRVMIAGTVLLFIDSLAIIVLYEALGRFVKLPLAVRAFLTMSIVLAFDSAAFALLAFSGTDQFQSSLVSGLIGKTAMAGFFAGAISVYFRWVEPVHPGAPRPLHDLFDTLTYREKYAVAREQALRSEQSHLATQAAILKAVGDGILLVSGQGQIMELNPAAQALFGCDRATAIGENLASWIRTEPPIWAPERDASLEPVRLHDVLCQGAAGVEFRAEVTVTSTRLPEGEAFIVCTHDLTQHHAEERQRRQTEMLAVIGALTAGIAHDFNNVLTIILSAVNLKKSESGAADEDLLMIESAAERAAGLTRQLLALGRNSKHAKQRVDAGRVVRELEPLLSRVIRNDILLSIRTPREGALILGDPSQIEQILLNLVVNATQAMPKGGQLKIELSVHQRAEAFMTRFGQLEPGTYVCLSVRDTGEGMAPATVESAFEIFFTTRSADQGTGLGLMTVRRLVTQLGGGLNLESSLHEGTTFEIWLPCQPGAQLSPEAPVEPVRAEASERRAVLVCDDDVQVGRVSQALLESLGFRAEFTSSAEAALRMVRRDPGRFEVLITDLVMPSMSGRDLAAAVRESAPQIRIVFVSGSPEEEVPAELEPVLSKPFNVATLFQAIHAAT